MGYGHGPALGTGSKWEWLEVMPGGVKKLSEDISLTEGMQSSIFVGSSASNSQNLQLNCIAPFSPDSSLSMFGVNVDLVYNGRCRSSCDVMFKMTKMERRIKHKRSTLNTATTDASRLANISQPEFTKGLPRAPCGTNEPQRGKPHSTHQCQSGYRLSTKA